MFLQKSWCKLEVSVPSPKAVNPFKESDDNAPKETPRLNILSLTVRTIVNHKENKREVVCASARKWDNGETLRFSFTCRQPVLTQLFCSRPGRCDTHREASGPVAYVYQAHFDLSSWFRGACQEQQDSSDPSQG